MVTSYIEIEKNADLENIRFRLIDCTLFSEVT